MKTKRFSVDARAILTWGRDSIKDHTTAVLELVKNSYDAGASVVQVEILVSGDSASRFIRIADDGCGMTESEIDAYWLRIGYSHKLEDRFTPGRRRKTGEKGIGRISADRLGSILELRTQAAGSEPLGLVIDWSGFEAAGRDISEVEIPFLDSPGFTIPARETVPDRDTRNTDEPSRKTGTELRISRLRHTWSARDLQNLRHELSVLTPPFDEVEDFQVILSNDVDPKLNGVVTSPFYSAAEIDAQFRYDKGESIHCSLAVRDARGKQGHPKEEAIRWSDFVHPDPDYSTVSDSDGPRFGPVSVRLMFYPRTTETLRGTELTLDDLRTFLNANAGIKVYRDRIRVMPYGSPNRPEGDWLGLGDRKARNPAGPGRPDYRVSPNQIVGAVFLGRDTNPDIVDTSGREGLIHSDRFYELRGFLFGCLEKLEGHYHDLYAARWKEEIRIAASPRESVLQVASNINDLVETLSKAETKFSGETGRAAVLVKQRIARVKEDLQVLGEASDELATQAVILRGLATLGIAAATFAHETESSLDSFVSAALTTKLLIEKDSSSEALVELQKAINYAERVSAWGAFALSRVKRDKRLRRSTDVSVLFQTLIEELRPVFESSNVELIPRISVVKGRTFPIDIESVLLNLLTNAYYFAKLGKRDRKVRVDLERKNTRQGDGMLMVVADSGPGVRKEIRDRIWHPLFSTKVDDEGRPIGTGLGLGIVDAIVRDFSGTREVTTDQELGGARFEVWLAFS